MLAVGTVRRPPPAGERLAFAGDGDAVQLEVGGGIEQVEHALRVDADGAGEVRESGTRRI